MSLVFQGQCWQGPLILTSLSRLLYLKAMVLERKIMSKSACQIYLETAECLQQNSTIRSSAEMSETAFQELCSLLNPFYFTRNQNLLLYQQLSKISSTSYSSSLLITIGSGRGLGLLLEIGSSEVADSFTTLNMGQSFFIMCSSLRQQTRGPTCHSTIKGPRQQCCY